MKYKYGDYVVVVSNRNERIGQVVVVNNNTNTYTIQYNDRTYGYKIEEKYIHLPLVNDNDGYSLRSKVINTDTTTNITDYNSSSSSDTNNITNIDNVDAINTNTITNIDTINTNDDAINTNIGDIKKDLKEASNTTITISSMNVNVDTFKKGIVIVLLVLMYTITAIVLVVVVMIAVVYVNYFLY